MLILGKNETILEEPILVVGMRMLSTHKINSALMSVDVNMFGRNVKAIQ